MATVYGYNDFTLESKSRTWTPDKGYAWTYVYRGPLDKADAFFETKVADVTSDSVTLDRQDGMGTITVTVVDDDGQGNPQNTEDNDLWEIVGQDTYKDLMSFSGRNDQDITPDISFTRTGNNDGARDIPTQLAGIRKAVELADPDQMPSGSDTYIPDKYYRRLMERGVTQYLRSTIVLRRTITCGRRSNIKASWAGVDRAWLLDGQTGSPNLRRNGQAALLGVIEDHPDFDASSYQWLKKAPQIQQVARRRYTITYEWWFAKNWSWVLYGGEGIITDSNGNLVTPYTDNC